MKHINFGTFLLTFQNHTKNRQQCVIWIRLPIILMLIMLQSSNCLRTAKIMLLEIWVANSSSRAKRRSSSKSCKAYKELATVSFGSGWPSSRCLSCCRVPTAWWTARITRNWQSWRSASMTLAATSSPRTRRRSKSSWSSKAYKEQATACHFDQAVNCQDANAAKVQQHS